MFEQVEAFIGQQHPRSRAFAARGRGPGRFRAGGTDLAVQGPIRPLLVDISKLGLNYIRRSGSGR